MPNVGKLIVDLEANTATFTGPLANAERLARGNAKGIQDAFNGMDFGSARGGIMVIDELIGIHIPRHVTALIAQMPLLGAAMEMAFPLLAVVAVGKAIFEFLEKMHTETEKLTEDQSKFQVATFNAFNALEQKLLEAGIHSDELHHNHLAALKKQLELINTQSMQELVHSFGLIATAADAVFKDLESHWYTSGVGSTGAKNALTQFKTQYEALLAQGKNTEASDLLAGTRKSAEHILEMQKQYQDNLAQYGDGVFKAPTHVGDLAKFREADNALKAAGVGVTEREVQAQQALVNALQAQVKIEADVAALKKVKTGNADADTTQKVIDEKEREWAETKKVSDAETKEALAQYEVLYKQGRISAEQLGHLKQAALDAQYQAEMEHLEKIKALEASRPDLQKKVEAEETALTAAHNTQILDGYVKTMDEQKKLLLDFDKFNQGVTQKQEAEAKKAVDEAIKTAAAKNKALLIDAALIQGEGNRRIAQLDKEIADLNRLIAQYHLQGDAAKNVYAAIHQLSLQRQKDIDEEARRSGKLGPIMRATMNEMIADGQQWKLKVADQFKMSVGEMNTALANFAATGKLDLQSLVQNAVQGFIMMALQYGESELIMYAIKHLGKTKDAASTAGTMTALGLQANALAMATIPPPAGEAAGAAIQGTIAGMTGIASGAMLMHLGGVVPGTGNGDIVPAMLEPGERVLTREENRAFTSNATSTKSDGGPKSVTINPTVHVPPGGSAKEFERYMENAVDRALRSHARRRGLRLN
jgi:hypothetical protein